MFVVVSEREGEVILFDSKLNVLTDNVIDIFLDTLI